MAKDEKPEEAQEAPPAQAQPAAQAAHAPKGKALKVAALVILLIAVVAIILLLALFGKDLFKAPATGGQPPGPAVPVQGETIKVGTPGAAGTITREAANATAQQEAAAGDAVYVYCRQLNAGDRIATMGDSDKYEAAGPAWFAYIDEQPGMWFEHPVKYVFIDASTGQKTVYPESWPPDVNGKDFFTAAGGECPGKLAPATEFEAEGDFQSNVAEL